MQPCAMAWRVIAVARFRRLLANIAGKYEGRGSERTSTGQYDGEFRAGVRNGHAEITPRSRWGRDVIAM